MVRCWRWCWPCSSAACSSPSPTRTCRPQPDTSSPGPATPSKRSERDRGRVLLAVPGLDLQLQAPRLPQPDQAAHRDPDLRDPADRAGLGVALAFRVGMFNIGGRGQIIIAAAVAGWISWSFPMPFFIHMLVAIDRRDRRRRALGRHRRAPEGADRRPRGDRDDHAELRRVLPGLVHAAHARCCCRRRARTTRSRRPRCRPPSTRTSPILLGGPVTLPGARRAYPGRSWRRSSCGTC